MVGRKTILGFCVISIFFCSAFAGGNGTDAPTAYDLLKRYNLPIGILPAGVQSYLLRDDGTFEVYLAKDCEFLEQKKYLLRYRQVISGTVSPGKLSNVGGVSVQILFLWISITEVAAAGDSVSFSAWPITVSFPISSFAECPICRGSVNDGLVADS